MDLFKMIEDNIVHNNLIIIDIKVKEMLESIKNCLELISLIKNKLILIIPKIKLMLQN